MQFKVYLSWIVSLFKSIIVETAYSFYYIITPEELIITIRNEYKPSSKRIATPLFSHTSSPLVPLWTKCSSNHIVTCLLCPYKGFLLVYMNLCGTQGQVCAWELVLKSHKIDNNSSTMGWRKHTCSQVSKITILFTM